MKGLILIISSILIIISLINAQRVENLGGLSEYSKCLLSEYPYIVGRCEKITNCQHEFERFRRNESVLKICEFNKNPNENIICCPQKSGFLGSKNSETSQKITRFFSLETCRDRYLSLRKSKKSTSDLVYAIENDNRTITDEDCMNIHLHGQPNNDCIDNKISTYYFIVHGTQTKEGDWQNMAALGWTQNNERVEYKCGGIIISERFILSAAHCRDRNRAPDTVRVGDRYLETPVDDDHSQQLRIEKFIPHPDYKRSEAYNDIAVIKTAENILFNEFVSPACIGDIDDDSFFQPDLKVAGYGHTEFAGQSSNVLLEITVQHVPAVNCSDKYEEISRVSKGIVQSQICTIGVKDFMGNIPDSCNGDSGGPVQYKEFYAIKDKDYDRSKMKTVYEIPVAVGLVSFGIACGLEVPSVNTRISRYTEWIETVMRN